MNRISVSMIIRLSLVTLALALYAGCGGGGGGGGAPVLVADPAACPESGMPKLPAVCCESGVRTRFDGDCAGPELGGVPPINGAISGASAASAAAGASLEAAAKLVCPSGTTVNAENKPVCAIAAAGGSSEAATAGDSLALAPPPTDPKKELDRTTKTPDSGRRDSGSGTGSSGSGGSGGAMDSMFAGKTAPSAPETTPKLQMDSNIRAAGAGAGPGKGPHGPGGPGLNWSSLGASIASVAGGTGNVTDFGDGAAGAVNPIGSEDPDDYFTKLGLNDSIFKVVERRYRTKSMDWITHELSGSSGGKAKSK